VNRPARQPAPWEGPRRRAARPRTGDAGAGGAWGA